MRKIIYLFVLILTAGNMSCSYLPEAPLNVVFEENADYIILKPSGSTDKQTGIVFYPGGLVDPHAYIDAFEALVLEDKRTVIIVKVTSNLAIWNSQKASGILDEIEDVDDWIIGGHSLGGSTACIDLYNNPDQYKGLFLMAAYSVNALADSNIPVISITSSEDQILDFEKLEENKVNLPEAVSISSPEELTYGSTIGTTIDYQIEGGNHSQFGNYGQQKEDGTATITAEEQQLFVTQILRQFLLANAL